MLGRLKVGDAHSPFGAPVSRGSNRNTTGRMRRLLGRWTPPAVKAALRRIAGGAEEAWIREERRLMSLPPFTRGASKLLGVELDFSDGASFAFTARELFRREIYRFISASNAPFIVDCGANVGLSVLYMKALYPEARIIAFEPDPVVFSVLEANIHRFGLKDVEIRQAAVWTEEGVARFRRQGGDAGRLAVHDGEEDTVDVRTVRLRDLLGRPIDLLKIDVEGAEGALLADCDNALERVERVFVEYHSMLDRAQDIDVVFQVLRRAGFRVHVEAFDPSPRPFLERNVRRGIDCLDMALNIWAFRT